MPEASVFLSVSAAAELLGVHVDTVRRWTDEGRLPETRTAGGHRRIPREAVERLMETERRGPSVLMPLADAGDLADQTWAQHAVVHARHELRTHATGPWRDALSDEDRRRSRENGQRLMGLLLQYVAGSTAEASLWPEVDRLARVYARRLRERGLPYREALQATLFFRDVLTESTAYYPHLHERPAADQVTLMRKVNGFMNRVQIAVADAYDVDAGAAQDAWPEDTDPA